MHHRLSPSAWNRWAACAFRYWLSRQGYPKRSTMASVLGTAVHGVVEDLLTIEAPGPEALGWMGDALDEALERRWLEAHTEFHRAPRHGRWKEDRRAHARDMAVHGLDLLLAAVGAEATTPDRITGGMWEAVRSLVLEVEVEATTFDDRLMGRIDLLLEDRDEAGQRIGFRVADLKTGRPPKDRLDSTVERQLLMYRDLISVRHPGTPVRAEGWYTEDRSIHEVSGPDVLEEAYEAWEATRDLDGHFPPSPGPACDRFCDWKAWCPHWWTHAQDAPPTSTFRDMVVLIHDRKGAEASVEECEPFDASGRAIPTGRMRPIRFDPEAAQRLDELEASGHRGAIYLGGAMADRHQIRVGHWSDVLPWAPHSP